MRREAPSPILDTLHAGRTLSLMDRPGTAAVLSFVIPGLGQFYNGKFLRGVIWLIITPGFWLGTGGFLGWICHVVSSYMAYSWAKDNPPES